MQLPLFAQDSDLATTRTAHGGSDCQGRRKSERPVSVRRPMHVTLHSDKARGALSLLKHRRAVHEALRACARRTGVRVYDFANVGSHLHLLVRVRRRQAFQAFLRSFAGIVARKVTDSRRGKPFSDGRFWSALAWSRVVTWGRDYHGVRHYILRNRIEADLGPDIRRAIEHGPAP
jgi:REP element-mobilizing transposase RayT